MLAIGYGRAYASHILNKSNGLTSATSYGKNIYEYELNRLSSVYDKETAEKKLKAELKEETVNTPIVAVAPGKVEKVTYEARAGFMVKIVHSSGDSGSVTTDYLHMKRWPLVNQGDYVGAGTLLGYEGCTGRSFGEHLHFEINDGGIKPHEAVYPSFNPFYYEEKAEEDKYEISSEYMSLYRTISMVNSDGGTAKKVTDNQELTNQHPRVALVEKFEDLIQKQGQMDRDVVIAGALGWNDSCEYSEEYTKYLEDEKYFDLYNKEEFFDKELAKQKGYLDIPPELYSGLYGEINVNTTMPGSLPPLSKQELEHIISTWLANKYSEDQYTWLMKNVFTSDTIDAMIEAQELYNVSPVFMLAVATAEQSIGLSGTVISEPGNYNIFSIRAGVSKEEARKNTDKYVRMDQKDEETGEMIECWWVKYDSYGDAFLRFSRLIGEKGDYFMQDRYTIAEIGPIYCPTGEPPGAKWVSDVTSIVFEMMEYYTGNWSSLPTVIIYNLSASDFVGITKYNISVLAKAGLAYREGGISIPPYDANKVITSRYVDCSSFVGWCLWEYAQKHGLSDLATEAKFLGSWSRNFNNLAAELSPGKVKYNLMGVWSGSITHAPDSLKEQLQAGDILIYYGTRPDNGKFRHHVEVFAGEWFGDKPMVWSCGEAPTGVYKQGEPKRSEKFLSDLTGVLRVVK